MGQRDAMSGYPVWMDGERMTEQRSLVVGQIYMITINIDASLSVPGPFIT